MLRTRILTAVALLVALLGALFFLPPAGWAAFGLLVLATGAYEWAGFARVRGPVRLAYVAAIAIAGAWVVYATGLWWGESKAPLLAGVYAAAVIFWCFGATLWLRTLPSAPSPALVLVLGSIVLIPTFLALVQLRNVGPWLLLLLMAVAWVADIAAYFAGRAFGRRKLAPRVSPGKSWEGVIGAFAATLLYALAWRALAPGHVPAHLGAIGLLALVWVLTGASVIGDLFESAMKRQAGLKDSGAILPGHGGVLDRIDALTSVMPLAALVVLR
ncbi:MAG: phosphatidate cytidylyltransferase [Burkholderiales bacterium]